MKWRDGVGQGAIKGRSSDIILNGKYNLNWQYYSTLDNTNAGIFKILINKV